MTRKTLDHILHERGWSLVAEAPGTALMYFHNEVEQDPSLEIKDGKLRFFRFTWITSKGLMITTNWISPVDNEEHFYKWLNNMRDIIVEVGGK